MKFSLTADQISAMIADGVAKALASQGASPQPASPHFLPKGSKAAPSDLADKDRQIVAAFKRRGFSVTLMDRNDPKLCLTMSGPIRAGSMLAELFGRASVVSVDYST
jgi:hypothetical protein